jgi:hypothetical protein
MSLSHTIRPEFDIGGHRPYENYAMWNHAGWCVIARELVGPQDVAVVSVQFAPIKRPRGSAQKPNPVVEARELEFA